MYKALYIHIPFCKSRCAYCDFETEALAQRDTKMDNYLASLIGDIRKQAKQGSLEHINTIYIGGGTPTHFGHGRLVELAYLLSLTIKLEQVEEYTVEVNPESLTPSIVKDLYALGVDRISMGVQSFNDAELQTLGRIHDAACVRQAFEEARVRFDNISIDLICGIPGQTIKTWQYSLEQALELNPEHISVYPLQIEDGTPLAYAIESGSLTEVDEDTQSDFLLLAARKLAGAGYERYEVASYAKPGRESKHNSSYWTGIPYLGIGRGAASMTQMPDGTRLRQINGGESEVLSAKEAAAEDLLLAMRMSRGVQSEMLEQVNQLLPQAESVFAELQSLGLVVYCQGCYIPTEKGWLLGNELYARLWELSEQP